MYILHNMIYRNEPSLSSGSHATSPQYDQYLTHAHSHITLEVAAMGSIGHSRDHYFQMLYRVQRT